MNRKQLTQISLGARADVADDFWRRDAAHFACNLVTITIGDAP